MGHQALLPGDANPMCRGYEYDTYDTLRHSEAQNMLSCLRAVTRGTVALQ